MPAWGGEFLGHRLRNACVPLFLYIHVEIVGRGSRHARRDKSGNALDIKEIYSAAAIEIIKKEREREKRADGRIDVSKKENAISLMDYRTSDVSACESENHREILQTEREKERESSFPLNFW